MKVVVETVNFIRARALNHRQFKQLLEELDANYKDVLYFSQVRWLSRGKTLRRVWLLKEEIGAFLSDKQREIKEFSDEEEEVPMGTGDSLCSAKALREADMDSCEQLFA